MTTTRSFLHSPSSWRALSHSSVAPSLLTLCYNLLSLLRQSRRALCGTRCGATFRVFRQWCALIAAPSQSVAAINVILAVMPVAHVCEHVWPLVQVLLSKGGGGSHVARC